MVLEWKKWFWRGVGLGVGVVAGLALLIGVWMWYSARPNPPKPWNNKAIAATYFRTSEIDNHKLRFAYVLENTTDSDFRISEYEKPELAVRMEQTNSFVGFGSESLKLTLPVYVPAKQRTTVFIETPDYGFKEAPVSDDASNEERIRQREAVAKHIREKMPNLNGFVLFDEATRYEIDFPNGWKDETETSEH